VPARSSVIMPDGGHRGDDQGTQEWLASGTDAGDEGVGACFAVGGAVGAGVPDGRATLRKGGAISQ